MRRDARSCPTRWGCGRHAIGNQLALLDESPASFPLVPLLIRVACVTVAFDAAEAPSAGCSHVRRRKWSLELSNRGPLLHSCSQSTRSLCCNVFAPLSFTCYKAAILYCSMD